MALFQVLIADSFGILALLHVLIAEDFGILALFRALIADNFGILNTLGKIEHHPGLELMTSGSFLTTLPTTRPIAKRDTTHNTEEVRQET